MLVQLNIPLVFADHLSPMMNDIFKDSETARDYSSARTKTACIINGSLAPYFKSVLVDSMKAGPYAIAVDGSNDADLQKMNPLTVRHLYGEKVATQFSDFCLTTGKTDNLKYKQGMHVYLLNKYRF